MTVAQMRADMSNKEFVEWSMYYAMRGQEQEVAQKMSRR